MKKTIRSVTAAAVLLSLFLAGCGGDMGFGTRHIADASQYGQWESYLEVPSFLPNEIHSYQVNSYSYTFMAYMDICYEVFLDITVTEEQFDELLTAAGAYDPLAREQDAYYCKGYREIVFQDTYSVYDQEAFSAANVGWADIEKIIYNPETRNIIYVCFHANDTAVYELENVAYFNRFSIKEAEYAAHAETP